ncbi:hypothetical protein TNCV_1627031 [Trichonephila clavipes]|nr:hypothetical protein TNCV_1627031 [Trichonephila clavipes]
MRAAIYRGISKDLGCLYGLKGRQKGGGGILLLELDIRKRECHERGRMFLETLRKPDVSEVIVRRSSGRNGAAIFGRLERLS